MNEDGPAFPSKFRGSVYNGHQRWHGDHGHFIKRDLAMQMIAQHLEIPMPDTPEQLAFDFSIPPRSIELSASNTLEQAKKEPEDTIASKASYIFGGVLINLSQSPKQQESQKQLTLYDSEQQPLFDFGTGEAPREPKPKKLNPTWLLNRELSTSLKTSNGGKQNKTHEVINRWEDQQDIPILVGAPPPAFTLPSALQLNDALNYPPIGLLKGSSFPGNTPSELSPPDLKRDSLRVRNPVGDQVNYLPVGLTSERIQELVDRAMIYRADQQSHPQSSGQSIIGNNLINQERQDPSAPNSAPIILTPICSSQNVNILDPPIIAKSSIDPLLVPRPGQYLSLSERFDNWRQNRHQGVINRQTTWQAAPNKKRNVGILLVGLVGATILGVILSRDSNEAPGRASVTSIASSESVNTTESPDTTIVVEIPAPVVTVEVNQPVPETTPAASETTISIPLTIPVATPTEVPTPPVVEPPLEVPVIPVETPVVVPVPETIPTEPSVVVVPPAEIPASVTPEAPPITEPIAETPEIPMPAPPSINEIVPINLNALPYTNALAIGVDRPNDFIQVVLNEYNRRYARAFAWNHNDGMFYEGRHILSPDELEDYNRVMQDVYAYIFHVATT